MLFLLNPLIFAVESRADTPNIDYKHAKSLNQSIGKIFLAEQTTFTLLDFCADNYKYIRDATSNAREKWNRHNQPILTRARTLQSRLFRSIKNQHGEFNTEKYALQVDVLVQNGVSTLKYKLQSYNPKQRHYLCNRIVLSVSTGEWDIDRKIPEAYQMIKSFK